MSAAGAKASLIGAPTDVGASDRGASMGPEALRVAGLVSALAARGLDVRDCGNLSGPPNPGRAAVGGYRHLAEVAAWNREVYGAVHRELGADRLPILLGGDHSLSIGSISAVARHCRETGRALRIIWLDAHADFNTSDLTPSGSLHGMPVASLCGFGPERARAARRRHPGHQAAVGAAGRYPQRRSGRAAVRARAAAGGVRHALHR